MSMYILNSTSSTTCTSNAVWQAWIDDQHVGTGSVTTASTTAWTNWVVQRALTQEEQAQMDAQRERSIQQAKEAESNRRLAAEKAEKFLISHLSSEQEAQYRRERFFVVHGGKTGKQYKVKTGKARNIEADGKHYCCHPEDAYAIPEQDVHLAQMLAIRFDEEEFLKRANVS